MISISSDSDSHVNKILNLDSSDDNSSKGEEDQLSNKEQRL